MALVRVQKLEVRDEKVPAMAVSVEAPEQHLAFLGQKGDELNTGDLEGLESRDLYGHSSG